MSDRQDPRVSSSEIFPVMQPEGNIRVHRNSKTLKRKPSDTIQFTLRLKLLDMTRLHTVAEKSGRSAGKQALHFILEGLKNTRP